MGLTRDASKRLCSMGLLVKEYIPLKSNPLVQPMQNTDPPMQNPLVQPTDQLTELTELTLTPGDPGRFSIDYANLEDDPQYRIDKTDKRLNTLRCKRLGLGSTNCVATTKSSGYYYRDCKPFTNKTYKKHYPAEAYKEHLKQTQASELLNLYRNYLCPDHINTVEQKCCGICVKACKCRCPFDFWQRVTAIRNGQGEDLQTIDHRTLANLFQQTTNVEQLLQLLNDYLLALNKEIGHSGKNKYKMQNPNQRDYAPTPVTTYDPLTQTEQQLYKPGTNELVFNDDAICPFCTPTKLVDLRRTTK